MFLNIITPCSRPHLLHRIAESINIPKENYRWIVVFDAETIPDSIPVCEAYFINVSINTPKNLKKITSDIAILKIKFQMAILV